MSFRKSSVVVCCLFAGLLFTSPSTAQIKNKLAFDVGAGFTEPVQHSDGRLDIGYNVSGGVGINFVPNFGIVGEFGFNHLGLTSAALRAAQVPDGNARVYSVTLNPIVHVNPKGRFDAYVIGGYGYYRRTVEFTQPTVATATVFDPFYGVIFPALVPADVVLGSFTQNKGGLNIGGGVSMMVRGDSKAKIFAETRYHYMFTSPVRTSILPVTFGFRW